MEVYRRRIMWSDQANGNRVSERASAQLADRRPLPAWRLTSNQLRELANPRPRDYEGEVAWAVDAKSTGR